MITFFFLVIFFPFSLADCPPGTIYETNFKKCYKFVNQPTGFLAAEQTCQGLGGHLVALGNGFETSFVSGVALGEAPNTKSFWIGANYLSAPTWTWTYNTPFSYSNWAPGQPADPSINQCGAVRGSDNYWTKELCNSQKPFVCSIDPNAVPVGSPTCPTCPVCTMTSTAVSTSCPPEPTGSLTCRGRCPADYTMSPIDCKCYRWYHGYSLMIFSDAQNFCQTNNGTLVKITSGAQNKWLADFLTNQGLVVAYPWIGLTCPGPSKDSCYWTDGSFLSCYNNFDILEFPKDQDWNGSNPHFYIRLDNSMDDDGMWLRCGPTDDKCFLNIVCMQDSQ